MVRRLTAAGYLALLLAAVPAAAEPSLPGTIFRDCPDCPLMIVLPDGNFRMGSSAAVTGREGIPEKRGQRERPVHDVRIPRPFAIGLYEVTRGEYAAFAEATRRPAGAGCSHWTGDGFAVDPKKGWQDPGFIQSSAHPVTCVSWEDAKAYADWLTKTTSASYRLPAEAEWEYAARAGTDTVRFWGDDATKACDYANVYDTIGHIVGAFPDMEPFSCMDGYAETAPVGSFRANGFGLHDMIGNVWEWVADCWHDSYKGAPADGSAWTKGGNCGQRVLRGGSWISVARYQRSANRSKMDTDARIYRNGFRVARDLRR